jgi:hypothetical protein
MLSRLVPDNTAVSMSIFGKKGRLYGNSDNKKTSRRRFVIGI